MNYFKKDNGYYVLKGLYDYNVLASTIKTPNDLANLMIHLSEKNWVNLDMLCDLSDGIIADKKWSGNIQEAMEKKLGAIKRYLDRVKSDGEIYHKLRANNDLRRIK